MTTCKSGRYRFEKTIITDDRLNSVLQQSKFVVLSGDIADYRVFVYVNPHVYGKGLENTVWVEGFKGKRVLFASRGDVAMAVLATSPFVETSVGFVDKSDGLSDLREHGRLTETYLHAEGGNVGLIAEIDLAAASQFTVAYGFGLGPAEAAHHASGALQFEFEGYRRNGTRSVGRNGDRHFVHSPASVFNAATYFIDLGFHSHH